ncbi:trehalase-like isoform X2 [Anthonomus grandis grandis]|uniref:trehalase-like isoform X2 n=2 Tax=Anthonomus grandis grandis TaxID=2921223 RepID=UPI002166692B|nr:trehalase-like isoform X2 [Anthonomus grandis grandis]
MLLKYRYATKVIFCVVILVSLCKMVRSEYDSYENLPPICSSDIYCHGKLLDTIQMARIYKDSKTFVDMKMKYSPNETMAKFDLFMQDYKERQPNREEVQKFVELNFDPAGQEFAEWTPEDWVEHPKFLDKIGDEKFKAWGKKLNGIWKILGRKMKDDVKNNKDHYSIIWVPNPVIVPGGRFREFYYWDTYWIIQGLLLSEMHHTVRGILENFLYIVEHYGHIPNGGRIYYLARSQPPLLVPMINMYYEFSNDKEFVQKNLPTMEKEFDYWMTKHSKVIHFDGKNYTLAVYGDRSRGPRPESYSEDVGTAQIFKDQNKKEAYYSELKAAAESGWDFSSRWFITNSTNKGNLTNLKTRSIVPVDLNAIIYWNAVLLSEYNNMFGNQERARYFSDLAEQWMIATTAILWHEEIGAWLDYDLHNQVKRDYWYPSNIAPLWTGCYNKSEKDKTVRSVLKYLQNKKILYPGGVPSSVEHTGEQWDYPNAWPPLQHMMIVGLNNTQEKYATTLAFQIAENWVRSNYKVYADKDLMFEKYDSTIFGSSGGGGEYEVQLGFGWTNGVIMDLLWRYADKLTVDDPPLPLTSSVQEARVSSSSISSITTALLALLVSLSAGFIGICIYKRRTKYTTLLDKRRPSSATYTKLRNIRQKVNASTTI